MIDNEGTEFLKYMDEKNMEEIKSATISNKDRDAEYVEYMEYVRQLLLETMMLPKETYEWKIFTRHNQIYGESRLPKIISILIEGEI